MRADAKGGEVSKQPIRLRGVVVALVALAGLWGAGVAAAATASVTATVRDFAAGPQDPAHPDFETYLCGQVDGLVASVLGPDRKPVPQAPLCYASPASFEAWYRDTAFNQEPGSVPPRYYTYEIPLTLTETGDGIYRYENNAFFPIDGLGFGNYAPYARNYHFTTEINTTFGFRAKDPPLSFRFCGDDDVWVFINGLLAIDIGGVHGQVCEGIVLDPATASAFGLTDGSNYPLDIFHAERHTTGSNFNIETTLALQPPAPQCSDGTDNDNDTTTDFPADQGCESAVDETESPDAPQCSDRLDNDGDGLTNYPDDPGCSSATDDSESPDPAPPAAQCADGLDNDGDGKVDFPADPGCASAIDDSESPDPVAGSTPGKVTGGGWIGTAKRSFGFNARYASSMTAPTGNLVYHDKRTGSTLRSISFTTLTIAGTHAVLTGTGRVDGVVVEWRVEVDDLGEPGRGDTFRISWPGYAAGGALGGGNVQVHRR